MNIIYLKVPNIQGPRIDQITGKVTNNSPAVQSDISIENYLSNGDSYVLLIIPNSLILWQDSVPNSSDN